MSTPRLRIAPTLAIASTSLMLVVAACGTTEQPICSPTDPTCSPTQPTDTTPDPSVMSVVSVLPADGATNIDYGANIVLRFSAPVDVQAAGQISIGSLAGSFTYAGALVTFDPDDEMDPSTTYQITATGVLGSAGEQMAGPFSSSFTTREIAVAASASASVAQASVGESITLDATGSAGTVTWNQIEGPHVGLLTGASPSFDAPDEMGRLGFELVATEGSDEARDTVWVTIFEDMTKALYVSPNGNGSNPGTREAPLLTIQSAIDAAAAAGDGTDVYVAQGTYPESLTLASEVSVYGGFDPVSWEFDPAARPVVEGSTVAVFGQAVSGVRISWMHITAADGEGADHTSIGVLLDGAVDAVLRGNIVEAGEGLDGVAGFDRANRTDKADRGTNGGSHGTCGSAGGGGGGSGNPGRNGGRGGNGGTTSGARGSNGDTSASGGGGGGAGANDDNWTADTGGTGDDGSMGGPGSAGADFGSLNAAGYVRGNGATGGKGTIAHGGGGGGGGYNNTLIPVACGGGGGGGGEGGEGGLGGGGGQGGGGSFGVLLLGTTTALVTANDIRTKIGGTGGIGGIGGLGELGGDGGSGGAGDGKQRRPGASGGKGGRGGQGGPGGGGGGGPSIGIVASPNATLDTGEEANLFDIGDGGFGGISGGTGINGERGMSVEVLMVGS